MNLYELDAYFNSFLHKEDFSSDISLNGIQIENSAPETKEIKKVANNAEAQIDAQIKKMEKEITPITANKKTRNKTK